MTQTASEIVERLFAALDSGDVATIGLLFADDIRFSTGGTSPISGEARGKAAVLEKMQKIATLTGGTARLELVDVRAAGDELALVHARRHAEADGTAVEADVALVVRVADDAVVEVADVMESRLEKFWSNVAGQQA